ncbi:hypothetical protein TNCV_49081 [Trichonephila clavipes]|nr:hypothetical protein TNCV_49081 [Trichonephila clavipes]
MFKGAKKEDLRRIASELELCSQERAGNRGILDESTFSEGVCVQTHKLHRGDFERGVFSGFRRSVYCNELRKIEIRFTCNRDLFH